MDARKRKSQILPEVASKKRKGHVASFEMLNMHDSLRKSLEWISSEVQSLNNTIAKEKPLRVEIIPSLMKVAKLFASTWKVFKAHASAEDEVLWPAIQFNDEAPGDKGGKETQSLPVRLDEKGTYAREHEEELMKFSTIKSLIVSLSNLLSEDDSFDLRSLRFQVGRLVEETQAMVHHVGIHLQKEEMHLIPILHKQLSLTEFQSLAGEIMGRRSADTLESILGVFLKVLEENEVRDMLEAMKHTVSGTCFDRWLEMAGWVGPEASYQQPPGRHYFLPADTRSNINPRRVMGLARDLGVRELPKLVRSILDNPALSNDRKCSIIECLVDSVKRMPKKYKEPRRASIIPS